MLHTIFLYLREVWNFHRTQTKLQATCSGNYLNVSHILSIASCKIWKERLILSILTYNPLISCLMRSLTCKYYKPSTIHPWHVYCSSLRSSVFILTFLFEAAGQGRLFCCYQLNFQLLFSTFTDEAEIVYEIPSWIFMAVSSSRNSKYLYVL